MPDHGKVAQLGFFHRRPDQRLDIWPDHLDMRWIDAFQMVTKVILRRLQKR